MFFVFLPFLSSALYGLGYVLLERILKSTNILSYMVASSIVFTSFLIAMALIRRNEISFSFLSDKKIVLLFLATFAANAGGWLITLNSLKQNTATYTAFAEISYPLFTVLFMFLFFGLRNFGWQSLLGSILIFTGSIILVSAQTRGGNP